MDFRLRSDKRINVSEFLLELALLLLMLNFLLYQCFDMDRVKDGVRFVAVGIMAAGVLVNIRKFRVDKSVLFYTLYCLLVVVLGSSVSINWPVLLVTAIVLRQVETDKLVDMLVRVSTVGVVVYFVLRFSGFIDDYVYGAAFGRVRNTLGFSNVNAAALFFFSWVMLLFCRKKTNKFLLAFSVIVLLWCMVETNTRSVILIAFIYFALRFLLEKAVVKMSDAAWTRLSKWFIIAEIGVVLLSVAYPLLLRSFPQLDVVLSYRLSIGTRIIQRLTLRNWLMGGAVGNSDNFFHAMLFQYGMIALVVAVMFVVRATWKMMERHDIHKVSFILSMWTLCVVETSLYRPEIMAVVLFWCFVIKENSVQNKLAKKKNRQVHGLRIP